LARLTPSRAHVASEVTTSVALTATGVGEFNSALRAGQAGLRLAYATDGVVVAARATTVINATDAPSARARLHWPASA